MTNLASTRTLGALLQAATLQVQPNGMESPAHYATERERGNELLPDFVTRYCVPASMGCVEGKSTAKEYKIFVGPKNSGYDVP